MHFYGTSEKVTFMKKTSLRLFTPFLFISFTLLYGSVELDYLNSLRTKTGIAPFSEESHIDAAAKNHSNYMQVNNEAGHYEDSSKSGYTGDDPMNRALYTDYFSRIVAENVSAGTATVEGSIDGLFSAIYHRFGFLNLEFDEIGIGVDENSNTRFYTYDMGNAGINLLCQGASASSGYSNVCSDSEKIIDATDFTNAIDAHKESAPELILWPPSSSDDIPPVFYEESPDPLPNDSVTGYPVSVVFNDGKFDNAPTVSSFILTNAVTESVVENIVVMNADNDPNNDFTVYQSALFPKKRLEWGTPYNATFTYNYNGVESTKNWCFETRSLSSSAQSVYRIENDSDISLDAISGKKYAIYVVPNNTNDTLGMVSMSYNCDAPLFSYIDSNTFSITITGELGQYITLSFNNNQTIKLTIATTDTATYPLNITCEQVNDYDGDGILDNEDLDDDNDGYSDIDENNVGSNPLDVNDIPLDTDGDMIPNYRDTDDDNDGISDSDEIANGLDPLNRSDAQLDFDNDGFTNVIEISVGSDIRNSTSKPIWTPVMMDNVIIFIPSFS